MQHVRRTVLAALLLAAATTAPAAGPTLKVGVEGAYPPFSMVGPDGKVQGFDIDVMNELCRRLQASCTQVQVEFDALIVALRAKKIDLIVASMSVTPERQKVVDFTRPYYNSSNRVVVRIGSGVDGTPAGLKGKRLGVQRNTIHDRYASTKLPGVEVVRYARQDDVYLDLVAGRVDATLCDSVAGSLGFLKKPAGKGFAVLGMPPDDPSYFGSGSGIATRKADTALVLKFNAAIKAVRAGGQYKKIQDKYFDFDVYGKAQ